jgi:phage baseplate assembly protein W
MAYADFAINETGDLLFMNRNDKYTALKIKFNISQTKAQKISFLTEESNNILHNSDNYLKIMFDIEDAQSKTTILAYKDDDALSQLIAVVLNEAKGELPYRTDEGSELSTYKHKNINSVLLSNLENYLKSFLSSYLNNPSVTAKPNISYTNGYKQVVDIYVYNNNDLLLKYTLES